MHVGPTRCYSWLVVGLLGAAVGCGGASSGSTGGAGSGGSAAAGGKSGGGSGGQNSGGNAGSGGSGGVGGSAQGGTTGSGGVASGGSTGTGGGSGGAASGGRASGGSGGSGGAPSGGASGAGGGSSGGSSGAGGLGRGGASATGGQGQGKGGGTGAGGAGTGGSGTGGRATGGATGSGGVSGTGGSTGYRPCPTGGTACKIMPFGDSITDGFNADTPGGYRVELFRRAHAAGKNITFVGSGQNGPTTVDGVSFPRNHEGHSGWTIYPAGSRSGISTLLNGAQSVMVKYTPDIVLLMIGTNDAIDNYDMANAPKRLGDLIDTIYSQLPNVLIVVAQPIPSRGDASKGDDTGLSARIKTYNDAIPAVVKTRADAGKHILVVDMYTPFTPKASLIEDQWHPNLQGYVILGTEWYSVLQSLL